MGALSRGTHDLILVDATARQVHGHRGDQRQFDGDGDQVENEHGKLDARLQRHVQNVMVVDATTEEDNAKDEVCEIQPEEVQVRYRLGPEDGFGDTVDPGRTDQDGAHARPGVILARDEHVGATREPEKRLHERDKRECNRAPEGDCDIRDMLRVVCAGFASAQRLCLAQSDKRVQRERERAPNFARNGGERERDGDKTEDGDKGGRCKRGPRDADARVRRVERTRPAEMERHASATRALNRANSSQIADVSRSYHIRQHIGPIPFAPIMSSAHSFHHREPRPQRRRRRRRWNRSTSMDLPSRSPHPTLKRRRRSSSTTSKVCLAWVLGHLRSYALPSRRA